MIDKSEIDNVQPEPQPNNGQKVEDASVRPSIAKPNVICRFSFGEWILIDENISGQIIDFYGDDWWMVDVDGKWGAVWGKRITKDNRFVSANGI